MSGSNYYPTMPKFLVPPGWGTDTPQSSTLCVVRLGACSSEMSGVSSWRQTHVDTAGQQSGTL